MHPSSQSLHGVYAITDAGLQPPELLSLRVGQAISGGARLIQYRDKSSDSATRLKQARALAELCTNQNAILIINDDITLAADSGAHGIHLGKDDAPIATARRILGTAAIIGASCYNRLELAETAADEGADYLAFGRFFPSQTKPDAVQADRRLIREARCRWDLPVAVIGGITPYNAEPLLAAGADMLAVVNGIFAAQDARQATMKYASLFC